MINNNLFKQINAIYRSVLLANTDLNNITSSKIPDGFEYKQIKEYCSIKSGYAFKSDWWSQTGEKVLKIGNIINLGIETNRCDCISYDNVKKAKDFCVGRYDMLIALTGATIGKIGFIQDTDEIYYVNQRVGKFFLGNNPILKLPFIFSTLMQPEYITPIITKSEASSAQANMSGKDIEDMYILFPEKSKIDKFNKETAIYFKQIGINIEEINQLEKIKSILLSKLQLQ